MGETSRTTHKYTPIMSADRQMTIRHAQERSVSLESQISGLSVASSAVSDFLGSKIEALIAKRDGLLAYRDGLFETREKLGEKDFDAELRAVLKELDPIARALKALENGKRVIEQDLEEEIDAEYFHAKRPRHEDPDIDFYERAYANTLVPRVMGASNLAKRKFINHQQAQFRHDVLERYGALKKHLNLGMAWCHVTSVWWPRKQVKAAHLVPKSLTGDELAFLFGVKELLLQDPRNGISLHVNIELALDSGKIAIVPVPTTDYNLCVWKCVLVDKTIRNQAACGGDPGTTLWKDLDGKELQFLTTNRPARRYLYFRFLITYLHAKQSGNSEFTSTVDSRQTFWASPGGYLERSTLKSLARNISGIQLPPSITAHTFDDASAPASAIEDAATIGATGLQDAILASTKRWDDKDESDKEESDKEDEDTDCYEID